MPTKVQVVGLLRNDVMFSNTMLMIILPLLLTTVFAEILIYTKTKRPFPWKQAAVSALIGLTYLASTYLISPMMKAINTSFEAYQIFTLPDDGAWTQVALFFVVDFFYYWQHRFAHRVKWFWANHSTHHSPEHMTLAGAYRISATSILSFAPFFYLPILILGFSLQSLTHMIGLSFLFQFFLHSDLVPKLGFLELLFNTPSHHRVHHATNDAYLDKNFGGILILFDRCFSTYAEEGDLAENTYGLAGREPSLNPLTLTFQEWASVLREIKSASTARARFFAAFGLVKAGAREEDTQPITDKPLEPFHDHFDESA